MVKMHGLNRKEAGKLLKKVEDAKKLSGYPGVPGKSPSGGLDHFTLLH